MFLILTAFSSFVHPVRKVCESQINWWSFRQMREGLMLCWGNGHLETPLPVGENGFSIHWPSQAAIFVHFHDWIYTMGDKLNEHALRHKGVYDYGAFDVRLNAHSRTDWHTWQRSARAQLSFGIIQGFPTLLYSREHSKISVSSGH